MSVEVLLDTAVKQQGGDAKTEHRIASGQLGLDGRQQLVVRLLGELVEEGVDFVVVGVVLVPDLPRHLHQHIGAPVVILNRRRLATEWTAEGRTKRGGEARKQRRNLGWKGASEGSTVAVDVGYSIHPTLKFPC